MADVHLSDEEIEALGAQLVKEMHEEFQASLDGQVADDSAVESTRREVILKERARHADK